MVKQHTHILNRFIALIVVFINVLCLSGCLMKMPEGDIKDFVDSFDYDETFNNVLYGSSTVISINKTDDIEQGYIETFTYFDRREGKYHYSKTILRGNYYGNGEDQFNYYEKETITYIDTNGFITALEKTDGIVEMKSYRMEDLDVLINYFFYTDNEYEYHKGGAYYGDYIIQNCAKYYDFFKLNEEKTELTFEVNSLAKDQEDKEIIIMHKYTVDKFGMVLNLSTTSMYKENTKNYTETTMKCDFTSVFEKKYYFN